MCWMTRAIAASSASAAAVMRSAAAANAVTPMSGLGPRSVLSGVFICGVVSSLRNGFVRVSDVVCAYYRKRRLVLRASQCDPGCAVRSFLAQQHGGSGKRKLHQRPHSGANIGDARVGYFVRHAKVALSGPADSLDNFRKIAR